MEIRILLDITDKLEKALHSIEDAIIAGGITVRAKDETAQNQNLPPDPRGNRRPCLYTPEGPTADAPKKDDAPTGESAQTEDAKESESPKKRAKAKKPAAPAAEIYTLAAMADGGKEGDGKAENVAEAESAEAAHANRLYGVYTAGVPELKPETAPTQENEDELGKGAVGEVISELTGRLITRMNEEARDKATINRNLRAKCEELQLKFPTVPALIQAIGYGNAYKACIGEG